MAEASIATPRLSNARPQTGISARHVHLAVWLYVLCQMLVSKVGIHDASQWLHHIAASNLLVLIAFLAIFHLLVEAKGSAPAERRDYGFFSIVVVVSVFGSLLGTQFDVALLCLAIAVYYAFAARPMTDGRFVSLVYFGLFVNGFLAPLIFMVFKGAFLIGEVELAVSINNLLGMDMSSTGTRLRTDDGLRLQMIGGCSVFSNLSLAFLGYAAFKAFARQSLTRRDIWFLLVIALCLILMNTIRIGLMVPSIAQYEFWHHGDGAVWFGGLQLLAILIVTAVSIATRRRPCGA